MQYAHTSFRLVDSRVIISLLKIVKFVVRLFDKPHPSHNILNLNSLIQTRTNEVNNKNCLRSSLIKLITRHL